MCFLFKIQNYEIVLMQDKKSMRKIFRNHIEAIIIGTDTLCVI